MGNNFSSLEEQYINTKILIGFQKNIKINELNALLQCLCHIKALADYAKYKFDKIEDIQSYKTFHKSKKCLTDSFKDIVEKIWPKDVKGKSDESLKTFSKTEQSKDFIEMIYKINPNYNENQNLLIEFIIKRLHEELNKVKDQNKNSNNSYAMKAVTDKNIALKNYGDKFAKENQSKISDYFYGTYYNLTFCYGCQRYLYVFQPYTYGRYSLDQVFKYKRETYYSGKNILYMNKPINFNEVNIYDCLFFDLQIQTSFQTCTNCKFMNNIQKKNIIFVSPIILTFIFNKNVFLQNISFSFEERINISQLVEKQINITYELIGIIFNPFENHYVAYCKNPIDNKWYSYDDDKVEAKNNFEEIRMIIGCPYMLFYQRCSNT